MTGRPVQLADVLRPQHVVAPLQAETIRAAVQQLIQRLVDAGSVAHPDRLARLVADEYIRDVIHVGDRVLLPHMRTDAVERLTVALGVAPAPLHLTTGGPLGTAQVVVLVLAPPGAADVYLQMVAALARVLRSDEVVDRLVAAASPAEVISLPEFRALVLLPRLTVRDVMTQRVYRVSPDTPVREVLELMSRHHLKAVPVVGEKREVLGMVSERELLRHLLPDLMRGGGVDRAEGAAASGAGELRVREIMSRAVMCISEDQAVSEVASIMVNKDSERLPVVSEGKLTGFLTRGDILRKLFTT